MAPQEAARFVLPGGEVCSATNDALATTVSIRYPDLTEAQVRDAYQRALEPRGYEVRGAQRLFVVAKGGESNLVGTMPAEGAGSLAVVSISR